MGLLRVHEDKVGEVQGVRVQKRVAGQAAIRGEGEGGGAGCAQGGCAAGQTGPWAF